MLAQILPHLNKSEKPAADSRLIHAVDFIEQNYTETITVDQLASVWQISTSRFFPYFKRSMGVTPINYIKHVRVRMVIIELMRNEVFSIKRISEKAGINSSAYLRRVFKRITGKTPREHRKTAMEI